MKINILASGSSGNCIALTTDDKTILVDAGIAKTKIEKALLEVNIRPDDVQAIFITHAHKDHTKGLPIANKYKIPVYAGEEEWKDIQGIEEDLQHFLLAEGGDITANVLFDFEGHEKWFEVIPFDVHHDAYEPKGYAVLSENKKISICLDTGHVDNEMIDAMKDSDIYIIEANHDPKMVERCNRPESVKTRILSENGHLSNQQTAEALAELIKGKNEQIYLVHLSSENNIPSLAEMTVKKELMNYGFIAGKHYEIEVI